MSQYDKEEGSHEGHGYPLVGGIFIVTAIGLSVWLFFVHFVQYWNSYDRTSLFLESLYGIVPIVLLFVLGIGLKAHQKWAHALAVVVSVCIFAGSAAVFAMAVFQFLRFFPSAGFDFGTVMAGIVALALIPVLLVTGWTLKLLKRRSS